MACGDMEAIMQSEFNEAAVSVGGWTCQLLDDEASILLADFQIARGMCEVELKAKVVHWSLLPWRLAGICHADLAKAIVIAIMNAKEN